MCEYFRGMGYGVSIRKGQASDYLAQVRTRGILTATRADYWHQAMGPLRALFTGSPPPRRAIVGSAGVLGPHPPRGSPLYVSEDQAKRYSPVEYLRNSWPWREYTRTLRGSSRNFRSYGWAAETFVASGKGWHGFFADTPHGPRFLHPKEPAVAQGFPWAFTLPACRTQAWQLLGNFVPPPMAYLGLGSNWAAEGFRRCCQACDGAWDTTPGGLGQAPRARSPKRSRTPPRHLKRAQRNEGVFSVQSPRWPSPQVAMVQGRRASEEDVPTSIWLDLPTRKETQDLLVALQAIEEWSFRRGEFPGSGAP